jgi:AraC-like DNA-binding protein
MEILYLASSVLALFSFLILLGKKKKAFSDVVLLVWQMLLFSNVFTFYLIIRNSAPDLLINFLDSSPFLHGPLIWFYTAAATGTYKKILLGNLRHFLPFICVFIFNYLPVLDQFYQLILVIIVILKFVIPLIYILLSLSIIARFRKIIPNIVSTINSIDLRWLSSILYGGIALIIIGAVTLLIDRFTLVKIPQYGGMYLNIIYSVCIILLGYFGFRQTSIFIPSIIQINQIASEEKVGEDKNNSLPARTKNDNLADADYVSLLQLMESSGPFTDPNLTLSMLAGQMGMSENRLSYIINNRSGRNFFEFINGFRIEMVIKKMKNGEHIKATLLGLAYDSGFNSKASFNRAFKKFTGFTPSEYLKRLQ